MSFKLGGNGAFEIYVGLAVGSLAIWGEDVIVFWGFSVCSEEVSVKVMLLESNSITTMWAFSVETENSTVEWSGLIVMNFKMASIG